MKGIMKRVFGVQIILGYNRSKESMIQQNSLTVGIVYRLNKIGPFSTLGLLFSSKKCSYASSYLFVQPENREQIPSKCRFIVYSSSSLLLC
jgi:hypothetical protein